MFKNKVECLQMLENTDKLDTLLKILKANGVQEFSMGGISLKFTHFVHIPAEDVGKFIHKNESDIPSEEEELLYYSAR